MLTQIKHGWRGCQTRWRRLSAKWQGRSLALAPVAEGQNCLGDDLDPDTVAQMLRVLKGGPESAELSGDEESRLRELAFWRVVAFWGYLDVAPKDFPAFQKRGMLESFAKTGWSLKELRGRDLVEIGCGPLGMIEFLPGRCKVACDLLNDHYARLFRRARSGDVLYCSHIEELLPAHAGAFDLAICYNVLDHTRAPRKLFDSFMELVKPGGRYLFQVNTVKEGEERSVEHARMHPSPFTAEQIRSWFDDYSGDCQTVVSDAPTALNEYYFMAFGRKDRRGGVVSHDVSADRRRRHDARRLPAGIHSAHCGSPNTPLLETN
jgi:SAM-dependent methyltransferase